MKFHEIKKEYKSFLRNRNNFLVQVSALYYFFALIQVYNVFSEGGNIIQALIKWGFIYYFIFIFVIMPGTLLFQWGIHELTKHKQ